MPDPQHPSCVPEEVLLQDCQITRTRAGGPGGQHRNKVESAIVITHNSGVIGQASERRSQHENRSIAVFRLRVNLAIAVRTVRNNEKIGEIWTSHCRNNRIAIRATHPNFPCILALAMDVIAAENYQLADAAKKLGCSTSQLIKLLKIDFSAFQSVNENSKKLGFSALK